MLYCFIQCYWNYNNRVVHGEIITHEFYLPLYVKQQCNVYKKSFNFNELVLRQLILIYFIVFIFITNAIVCR